MNDITNSIHINLNIEEMLHQVMGRLGQLMVFENCHLVLLKDHQTSLIHISPLKSCELEQEAGWTALHELALLEGAIIQKHVSELPSLYIEKEKLLSLDIHTIIMMPLYCHDDGIGVLLFGRKDLEEWDEDELDFLRKLSNQITIMLEKAHLFNELLHSQQEWVETFKAIEDIIVIFNQDLEVEQCNDSAKEFTSLESLLIAAHPLVQSTFVNETPNFIEIHLTNDLIFDLQTYPIKNRDLHVYGVIAYFKNVTKKRNMEAQLLHSGKLAAIGEMAAGIAHELNSPLTAILGNSQILLRNYPSENTDAILLQDIKNCGNRCKEIIKSLLTFSRQNEYSFTYYSLNEAVQQVLNLLKFQLEKNRITIQLSLMNDLPLLKGSQPQIEQIIINLLLNARDALDMGKAEKKRLIIETYAEEDYLALVVRDNGIGIESERIPLIFHPFHTTKDMEKGTGLGLSVSLGIAKDHSGTIEVTSSYGKGSSFILKLPLNGS